MNWLTLRRAPAQPSITFRLGLLAVTLGAGLLAAAALLAGLGGPAARVWAAPAVTTRTYPGAAPCAASLQGCINGSAPGDTIVIQPGVYAVGVTLAQAVNLTGVSSATVTLHALGNQRVLTVTGAAVNSSVVISGLTFSGGHVLGSGCPQACGGAILISNTAQPRLTNLIIKMNTTADSGGGIYATAGSPLSLSNVVMLSNTATNGFGGGVDAVTGITVNGGMFVNNQAPCGACQGGALYSDNAVTVSNALLQNNTSGIGGGAAATVTDLTTFGSRFQNNSCSLFACVGGAVMVLGNLTMSGTQVLSNTSTAYGGGAFVGLNVTLSGTLFRNNQGTIWGGGLSTNGSLFATGAQFISNTTTDGGGGVVASGGATMLGSLFQDNRCTAPSCSGGGLWSYSTLALTNTQFIANYAHTGGGLYYGAGTSDGRLVNTLFAANVADFYGSELVLNSPGHVTLLHTTIASPTLNAGAAVFVLTGTVNFTDTLFANHSIGIENGGGVVFEDYSLFANVSTPHGGLVSGGLNSHPGAAGFIDPAHNNYHLAPGSAAIDVGANAGINFDIDGDHRPIGNGFDIGFDEVTRKVYLPLLIRR